MQCRNQARHVIAGQRIEDGLGLAPRGYDPFAPQLREMLGEGGLAQSDLLLQRRHRFLALMQVAKHHQAMPIGDRFQQGLSPASLG